MSEAQKQKITPVFDILEEAIKIWWKNLKKFIMVYLIGFFFTLIPLLVVLFFYGLGGLLGPNPGFIWHLWLVLISIVGFAFALYFFIRAYMALFLVVKKNFEGNEATTYKETAPLFWPYLGLVLMTAVFVALWSLLLIIPGIIYAIFYSLAVYVFFFEGKYGLKAIRRSIKLVNDYWWPVFGRLIVVGLIFWAVMVVIAIPLSFASYNGVFYQIWNGLIQVINFLLGPIILLFMYRIYKDLAKIKPA